MTFTHHRSRRSSATAASVPALPGRGASARGSPLAVTRLLGRLERLRAWVLARPRHPVPAPRRPRPQLVAAACGPGSAGRPRGRRWPPRPRAPGRRRHLLPRPRHVVHPPHAPHPPPLRVGAPAAIAPTSPVHDDRCWMAVGGRRARSARSACCSSRSSSACSPRVNGRFARWFLGPSRRHALDERVACSRRAAPGSSTRPRPSAAASSATSTTAPSSDSSPSPWTSAWPRRSSPTTPTAAAAARRGPRRGEAGAHRAPRPGPRHPPRRPRPTADSTPRCRRSPPDRRFPSTLDVSRSHARPPARNVESIAYFVVVREP